MNSFKLFLLSSQKHPPYHHTFQRAILAKFPIQFNSVYILCRHCLHHFSKFSGIHFESIMVNSQRLRICTCYSYLGKLIDFKIKMPLLIRDLLWYFPKWQLAYLEYLCNIEWLRIYWFRSVYFLALMILTWKNLFLTEFSTKIHWNTRLAASDTFHMFTQSIKFF